MLLIQDISCVNGDGIMSYCIHCGEKLDDATSVCPKCGNPVGNYPSYVEHVVQVESSGLGTASLVFAIIFPFFIFSIILSIIGLCVYKSPRNKKMCKVALIICACWIALALLIPLILSMAQ